MTMVYSKSLIKVCPYLIGLLFIISGYSKAVDYNYFSSIVQVYIPVYSHLIAYFVIITELLIGVCLILEFALRYTALLSIGTVIVYTTIYSYGLLVLGATDCGCFGKIHIFNEFPTFLYIRNSLIIIGLIWTYRGAKNDFKISITMCITTLLIIITATALCFQLLHASDNLITSKQDKISISEHNLGKYVQLNPDSTYLIAIFSYECPHCINTIGNLTQYEKTDYINEIIGLCISDSINRPEFYSFFDPNFRIIELSEESVYDITDSLPQFYFIRNDSIITSIKGGLPSAYFVKTQKL